MKIIGHISFAPCKKYTPIVDDNYGAYNSDIGRIIFVAIPYLVIFACAFIGYLLSLIF